MASISTSSLCPRRGYIWLTSPNRKVLVLPTTCKTWGCRACRVRVAALFSMRVEAGVLAYGGSWFITLTYKQGSRQVDAECVRKDWKAFWRMLRETEFRSLSWLRVVELTKKGQPHLHLVMQANSSRPNCYGGGGLEIRRYRHRWASCQCVAHMLSRAWYAVTGDSWIVDVSSVRSRKKSGDYLGKYLQKGDRFGLEALGFTRRWSSSKGWAGTGRIRLRQSKEAGGPGWERNDWSTSGHDLAGKVWDPETSAGRENDPLLDRVGPDLVFKLTEEREKGRVLKILRSGSHETNIRPPSVTNPGSRRRRHGDVRDRPTVRFAR